MIKTLLTPVGLVQGEPQLNPVRVMWLSAAGSRQGHSQLSPAGSRQGHSQLCPAGTRQGHLSSAASRPGYSQLSPAG